MPDLVRAEKPQWMLKIRPMIETRCSSFVAGCGPSGAIIRTWFEIGVESGILRTAIALAVPERHSQRETKGSGNRKKGRIGKRDGE